MPQQKLSPEAFGTLLAMKRVGKIRFFEADVGRELTRSGLAELQGKSLVITKQGKEARRVAKSVQRAAIRKHSAA